MVLLDLFYNIHKSKFKCVFFWGGISMSMIKFKIKANNCVGISKLIDEKLQEYMSF